MSDRRYPGTRSPEEVKRSMLAARKILIKQKEKEHQKNVRFAKGVLIFVSLIQLLLGIYLGFGGPHQMMGFYIEGGIGFGFLALYLYSRENAVLAFTISLIVYSVIQTFVVIIGFMSISSGSGLVINLGVIIKIMIISALISGLKAAKKVAKKADDNLIDQLDEFDDL